MPDSDNALDTVLVAYDGSPAAQSAALAAIQIAQCQSLRVRGIYVVDEVLVMGSYTNYHTELGSAEEPQSRSDLIGRFAEKGEAFLWQLAEHCHAAGVPVTTEIILGDVPELVLREAAAVRLLALGRCGHGHAGDLRHLGRNFRAIAHHARVPLLIGGEHRPIERLLLAYNGSDRARRALTWASLLQQTLSAEMFVIIVQEGKASGEWLAQTRGKLAQSVAAGTRVLYRTGDPAVEIVSASVENQVDLIVMGGYRHHVALLEWLDGSTLDRVLRTTSLPVLVA